MAAIWVLSSQSTLPQIKGILGFDKVQHFIAYSALAFALGLWFSREQWRQRPWRSFLITLAIASLYGALDEFHQYFVPGRDCNIWDWIADTLGGAFGAISALLVLPRLLRIIRAEKYDNPEP